MPRVSGSRMDRLHREDDQPARIYPDGTQEWWRNGCVHREGDQPARIWSDGMQQWWTHGAMTRVTDFRESSDRFALVQAVVAIGTAARVPCETGSALRRLLQAVQAVHALPCDTSLACHTLLFHLAHEHAFLVALFL